MKNKNKHIDSKDAFSDLLRQKLEGHQLPVDVNVWSQLEKKLHPKRKKIAFWWMTIGWAAVIALLFSIQPFTSEKQFNEYTLHEDNVEQNQLKVIPTTPKKNIGTVLNSSTKENAKLKGKPQNTESKTIRKDVTNQKNEQTRPKKYAEIVSQAATEFKDESENITVTNQPTNNKETGNHLNDSISKTVKRNSIEKLESEKSSEKEQKKKHEWLLAAAFGSGGSASLSGSNDMLFADVGDRFMVNAQTRYTQILTPNDFTNKSFMEPISFGLTIRKDFNDYLAIETGLVYTYLFASFEENRYSHYDATLSLHYLGIPANLIIPIWKNPKWEVYLSGGGMIEKGLRSVYIQNEYVGNQIITTDARASIEGYQWSVNAAMGGAYKIQRNIDIYFEPKFSYFFDNNQPLSARTDIPVVIGLSAGVRFKL